MCQKEDSGSGQACCEENALRPQELCAFAADWTSQIERDLSQFGTRGHIFPRLGSGCRDGAPLSRNSNNAPTAAINRRRPGPSDTGTADTQNTDQAECAGAKDADRLRFLSRFDN
jgi:hypothetical protein